MNPSKFDVIIVGAGPAGATAAYILAKKGVKVLLVEKGRGYGSKQVFGGRIYASPLRQVFEDLEEAPIHRWVTKEKISIVDQEKILTVEYSSPVKHSFTTYLTEFTSWIVKKAIDAGAVYVDEVRVDNLLVNEKGYVVGIEAQGDKVFSNIVIDAEGANRLLLERLGLVEKANPQHLALGAKEVIKIGSKNIEERFSLSSGEGLAWVLVGDVTGFIPGGAFIYTNRDSVSLGVVIHLASSIKLAKQHVYEMVEKLRLSPHLKRYLEGGDIIEYSAHLTIESGYKYAPKKLATHGLMIVGDAAGLLLNTGLTFRGVDYAIYSGYLSAQAALKALEKNAYDEETLLELYARPLKQSFIWRDLKKHRGVEYLMSNPDLFKKYVSLMPKVFSLMLELGDESPTILEALTSSLRENNLSLLGTLYNMYKLVKTL